MKAKCKMLRLTVTSLFVNNIFLPTILVIADFQILLLHTANLRSTFQETIDESSGIQFGGFSRIAYVIKEARNATKNNTGPPVIYVDVGDLFGGSIWFAVHKQKIAADFMNALEPNAMAIGEHEFDFGIEEIVPFLKSVKFPLLASNFKYSRNRILRSFLKQSIVVQINNTQVGIISYLTPDVKHIVNFGKIEIEDEVSALKNICKSLNDLGIKTIIALGHASYKSNKRVAKFVKQVDVVIGGHDKILQWNGREPNTEKAVDPYPKIIKQKYGKIVPVAEAYGLTKYMGRLLLTFHNNGSLKNYSGQPIFLNKTIPQDNETLKLFEKYKADVKALSSMQVARSRVILDNIECRLRDCNFGNFVLDAFIAYRVHHYNGVDWTDTPIALMNAGAIRETIDPSLSSNRIFKSNILSSLPYQQMLYIIELSGHDLMETLELGLSQLNKGGYLLISGLRVVLNAGQSRTAQIVSVKARCAACEIPDYFPLKKDSIYKIITTHHILNGEDGYTFVKQRSKVIIPLYVREIDAVLNYCQMLAVVMAETDERMIYEDHVVSNMRQPTAYYILSLFMICVIIHL